MKATQKLKVTIETISYETTFAKLDKKLLTIAKKLNDSKEHDVVGLYVTSGNAELCIQMEYIGPIPKDAGKKMIFGEDEEVFMARQYK